MRRVVVTGLGLVTPLGCGVPFVWDALISSRSGLGNITTCDASDLACQVAGEIPRGDAPGEFNPDQYMEPKEQRKMDEFIHFSIAAAHQAVEDAGIANLSDEEKLRAGVIIGSGIGGIKTMESSVLLLQEKGPRRISPFFIPSCLINLTSGHVSIRYGLKGPNLSVVTACSTGAHAIGDGAEVIKRGDADIMVAGGAESAICRAGVAGFAAARALSTNYNDAPTKASRPWDKGRDGFVMGEGAGVVVLEEYEHAKKRGATIYAEIIGYGMSGDAYHITAPAENGDGGFRSMQMAMTKAGLNPEDVGYINAHGTSTPLGDEIELGSVKRLFGDAAYKTLSMSSTKSSIGHLLGAAGSVEAIFSILAMRDGILPPTLNLDDPSDSCDIDLVPHVAKEKKVEYALSNSFGFGGTNATLIMRRM